MDDWTSAEVQIAQYPPVDIEIQDSVIEIEGEFFEPEEDLWVTISIAKGSNFGGSYRFPLEIVPLPTEMFVFQDAGTSTIEREHSFWWRSSAATPFYSFGRREKYYFWTHIL